MKVKLLIWIFFILFFTFLSMSKFIYADTGYINDDIQCESIEIYGENSLYVTGDLTYYAEQDKKFNATIYFCNIFNEVIARAYIQVILKENDGSVIFEAPINIDDASDPMAVKSTHHIQWKINAIEKIECCADHAGINGCDEDSGKIECYDGVISDTCTCDEYNISE